MSRSNLPEIFLISYTLYLHIVVSLSLTVGFFSAIVPQDVSLGNEHPISMYFGSACSYKDHLIAPWDSLNKISTIWNLDHFFHSPYGGLYNRTTMV